MIQKQIDTVTIADIENALSGNAQLADSIIIRQQADELVIKQPAVDNLNNK